MECNRCRKLHVGKTETVLHVRMNGLQLNINHRHVEKPVAQHFNSNGHSLEDLYVFLTKKIHREEATFHKAKATGFRLFIRWPQWNSILNHTPTERRLKGPFDIAIHNVQVF